jgi:lipoprotein-anchoring transpeptidase ErfK/SrfK
MRAFANSKAQFTVVGIVAAGLVAWAMMLNAMSTSPAAAQTQVRYNFTGTNFASPAPSAATRPATRPATWPATRSATWPATRPATWPATRPATRPAARPAARSVAQPAVFSNRSRSGTVSSYSGKRIVDFTRPLAPGTVLIKTDERRLYFVLEGGKAVQYGVGVGREGFTWRGRERISRKAKWPGWSPPPRMIERERAKGIILPAHMPGGPDNPLGARALYLGGTLFRIHGTNQPHTIGHAASSGCIRMINEEVIDLYDRVKVGTLVIVE